MAYAAAMANVTTAIHDKVLVVTINRPEVRNAVDRPTADELHQAFVRFDADDALSVAILTGAGTSFCAGADLRAMTSERGNKVAPDGPGPLGPTRLKLRKPTIAAVEGYAVAGGLELAIWCDLRVAARDATFGVFCRRWGVPLVDGGTVRLARLVGGGHAMDMVLTGRAVGADEALRIGLVNRVAGSGGALALALELARQIAAFPQKTMRSDRQSLLDSWSLGHDEAMANETRLGLEVLATGEIADGVAAYLRGRHG
jgi:enoyl-CoA hydratase/carnithine racemase